MTEITDAEAAEVLWASSEQGKAAVMAAWERWEKIRHNAPDAALPGIIMVDRADISAIVYAAYLAAGWDAEAMEDEPAPVHLHCWEILGVQPHMPAVMFGKPIPHTIVLMRCSECGEPDTRMLPGEWAKADLEGSGEQQR